jgi:hypothetical protein
MILPEHLLNDPVLNDPVLNDPAAVPREPTREPVR